MSSGSSPKYWKAAHIVPIFKKGDRQLATYQLSTHHQVSDWCFGGIRFKPEIPGVWVWSELGGISHCFPLNGNPDIPEVW